jgi:PIN domain nuclease of toxin-antitoxin system
VSDAVLDASAVLAVLRGEPGAGEVARLGPGASVSSVSLSEVVAKLADKGVPEPKIRQTVDELELRVVPFDREGAFATGLLRPATRGAGLSLADRACLALAERLGAQVVTADRRWLELDLPITVRSIR